MIPSWLVIGGVTLAVAFALNQLSSQEIRWFKHLRRPQWLTFEAAIPVIWTLIFICGVWSAYIIWEANPGDPKTWWLMGFYLLVEVAIAAIGFVLGCILAITILPISTWAAILLVPYLLWSPVGTYVTWQMAQLNPQDA